MLSITLRQLEYATAIARHGSVTLAANALHVSQPALSVAVAQLEHHLGKPLFLRRAGGPITPTSFGRSFLDTAESQLAALSQMLAANAPTATPIRLACFEDLAPVLLAPLLRRLTSTHPDITITPQVLGFDALTDALHRGQIDLALTYDLGLQTGITRRDLARVTPHAVLAADHPLAAKAQLSLADIAAYPLILADQGQSLGHMRALFSQRGLTPTIAHRTATLELMRSFAANGLGVGLSYTRPAPSQSYDGQPLALRPIHDAG
ncbi:MAG: LysR family transcriptional regulator [Paracoccaceae bacterium]